MLENVTLEAFEPSVIEAPGIFVYVLPFGIFYPLIPYSAADV